MCSKLSYPRLRFRSFSGCRQTSSYKIAVCLSFFLSALFTTNRLWHKAFVLPLKILHLQKALFDVRIPWVEILPPASFRLCASRWTPLLLANGWLLQTPIFCSICSPPHHDTIKRQSLSQTRSYQGFQLSQIAIGKALI